MANIFISYSHREEPWKDRVARQLAVLAPAGLGAWDDRRIPAGDDWRAEINGAIAEGDLAVLLVSADFLDSAASICGRSADACAP